MKYVTSRFIDEERENIEVLWEREDGGFITTIVPADELPLPEPDVTSGGG